MDPKYIAMAEAALEAVYNTAPDIFSDVWCVLQEMGDYDTMVENMAQAIKDAEEKL